MKELTLESISYGWRKGTKVHLIKDGETVCGIDKYGLTNVSKENPLKKICKCCRKVLLGKLDKPKSSDKPIWKKKKRIKKALAANFYMTSEWHTVRYKVLKMNNGCCELCGRSKHEGVILHVDHIKPKSKYPELALSVDNLQVLCAECNFGKSNVDNTDWRTSREKETA